MGGEPTQAYSAWMAGEQGLDRVSEPFNLVASTDLYPQLQHPDAFWTQGVSMEWLPYALQGAEGMPIEAVDVDVVTMSTTSSTLEASKAWEGLSPTQMRIATVGEDRASTCLPGKVCAGYGRGGLSRAPLFERSLRAPGVKWNCSVKNSFLHVEIGYDSDSTDDHGSWDGGSSQRSSSVPSRLDYAEPAEEWHKRYVNEHQELAHSRRYTNDLASLNFAWEMPGLLGFKAHDDVPTPADGAGVDWATSADQALILQA